MKNILVVSLAVMMLGCQSRTKTQTENQTKQVMLDPEAKRAKRQQTYLAQYLRFKERIVGGLDLPANASWDQIRPRLAVALKLSADTAWETILSDSTVQVYLTDEKRQKIAQAYDLPSTASWIEIKDVLEAAKVQAKK